MRKLVSVGALVLAFGTLGACSDDPGHTGAEPTPTYDDSFRDLVEDVAKDQPGYGAARVPDCATVWKAGARLPKDYQGCTEAGRIVPKVSTVCVGQTRAELVTFGDMWAMGAEPIRQGSLAGEAYQAQYLRCIGG